MPTVATVRMRYSSQEYWFDPNESGAQAGDHVVVETARGTEIGLCTLSGLDVEEADVVKPLKPIVRVATDEDLARADEMAARGRDAMRSFRELVEKHKLDMKPVDVDFMFDGAHATFYFTAEERVDFRALVRDLAAQFHVRVDMRQIGVRDEARMFGGLGHCGEELCCARMGGEFKPVSIRMAKEQDLPLNPSKISGLCGRLMCCLRYEFEAYKDFKSRAPKKGALIDTPLGMAKVVEFDTPRETLRVRFEDGKSVTLPLAALDTGDKVAKNGENLRPCHISQEKFDEVIAQLHADQTLAMMGEKLFSDDPNLTDKTAEGGAIERNPKRRRRRSESAAKEGASRRSRSRKPKEEPPGRDARKRRRSVSVSGADGEREDARKTAEGGADASQQPKKRGPGNRRRRRGSRGSGSGSAPHAGVQSSEAVSAERKPRNGSKPRPGQHSSGVSGDAAREGGSGQQHAKSRRRRRRRSTSGKQGAGSQGNSTQPKAGE